MQSPGKTESLIQKPVILLLLMVVAFLPVISMQFFLKNDTFTSYFPPKFFMSESLQDGILPLWNPYINFGIPQYADMNAGYWSPVTWLIAGTIGYSAYSITLEVMFYIFLSGFGMYLLCRNYKMHLSVCVIAGASYMCCGYMVGHMQHFNWISAAAFLPFCTLGYRKFYYNPTLQNVLQSGFFFYLFISSAHPGLIIGSIYFFGSWGIFMWYNRKNESFARKFYNYFTTHFVVIFLMLILCAGLIIGYLDILPYFTRIQKPPETEIQNTFNIPSYISFLLPFSTTKNDSFFSTDIAMRNGYLGLTMIVFFVVAIVRKKTREQWLLLSLALFFLLAAGGGIPGRIVYHLPLIGYVRFPGEYAIFSLFAIIIFSSISLNRYVQGKFARQITISIIINFFQVMVGIIFLLGLIFLLKNQDSIVIKFAKYNSNQENKLKWIIDNISFYDALVIQSLIQFFILAVMKNCLMKKNFTVLIYLVLADMAFATLLNIPYTAVGQKPVKYIAGVLSNSPKGIPIPALQPISSNNTGSLEISNMIGDWSFYNKQPGNVNKAPYAIQLFTGDKIYEDINKNSFTKPFVYLKNNNGNISLSKYTGSEIIIHTNLTIADTLIIQQAVYPHWFFEMDNKGAKALMINNTYPGIHIPAGIHQVRFFFKPSGVKAGMIITIIAFILVLLLLIFKFSFPSSLQKRLHP
ncbi:MAG: hypothetical protein ABIT96_13165 [Ferruginibacter sp.]